MISVFEVVVDPDMIAPKPYTILRSTGHYVLGGFESTVTPIPTFGPVQQASNKEIQMLPEADRVSEVRSFWNTQPIYTTRGYAAVPGVYGEAPQGGGLSYALSLAPPSGSADVYANGLLLRPNGVDYTLTGTTLTFTTVPTAPLYATWQTTVNVAPSASDQIQYEESVYRVMNVYLDPGSGYWKAVAVGMAAA